MLHNRDTQSGDWLKSSWDTWDAGAPSESVWEELEASVVSESVWSRVHASLEAEEHLADSWIVDSHNQWEPSGSSDVWERLNESISLERVWRGLDQSLNQPAAPRRSYWKLAVASIAALLISTHFTDTPVGNSSVTEEQLTALSVEAVSPSQSAPRENHSITPSQDLQHQPNGVFVAANPEQRQLPENQFVQPSNVPVRNLQTANRSLISIDTKNWNLVTVAVQEEDQSLPSLVYRTDVFPSSWSNLNAALAIHNGEHPMPFNHWTAQVGAQLSILQERNQELLTSTLPRFGLAADLSYRHKVGPFQLIHSLGVSQYSQAAGKYVNGRHLITNQQVNAAQLHSTVGYTYKRFTLYGGLLVSKMLNGLEQNDNTVTKVYDFGRLQAGLTAGIDVRILTFPRSGNQLSFGSQYQWIPSSGGSKSSFENIQGLRFQTKFSF